MEKIPMWCFNYHFFVPCQNTIIKFMLIKAFKVQTEAFQKRLKGFVAELLLFRSDW